MSAPDAATWTRVRAAFEEALELSEERRAELLARLGTESAELRRRVEGLLAADADGDDFLEPVLPTAAAGGLEGRDVGGFRILRVLAEGGMGTVYEAEQASPQRRVALKTMRLGLTSAQSRRRFQYEGELLAKLRHPNIAQVLGAGVLELEGSPGLPWLALELVEDARPLTALGRDAAVPLHRRLRLFLRTCEAVHHAHQRGVLHRDIKGPNVLVDGEGHVKVIDFGIARPLVEDAPTLTRSGEVVGTLATMAPEQVAGRTQDVDVRTDVYALGVLLHELVCGAPPYDLRGLGLGEAARVVEAGDPAPPTHHAPGLPRELDWIVARAMARAPEERYDTVRALAADVGRLLDDEPVEAGPPSTVYRLRKYVRRHRLAVVAAAGALLALVAGLIGTSLGLVEARASAVKAEAAEDVARRSADEARAAERDARTEALLAGQLFDFFQDGLAAPDPGRQGRDLTMLEFLRTSAAGVDERFPDRPLVAGLLHRTIGRAFHGLGEDGAALTHVGRAVDLLATVDDVARRAQARRELAEALRDLAIVRLGVGDLAGAAEALDRHEAELRAAGPLDPLFAARIASVRGRILLERGDATGAEPLLREALAALAPDDGHALGAATSLGGLLHRTGRISEAVEVYRAAQAAVGPDTGVRVQLYLQNNLAMALQASGDAPGALRELEALLPGQAALFGESHPDVVGTRSNIAALYFLQGRQAEALPQWRASLAALEADLPDEHPVLQTLRVNLGVAAIDHGDPAEAEALLRGVHALRVRELGPDDERCLKVQYELARALARLERYDEAIELTEDAAGRLLASHGEAHETLPLCEYLLGTTLASADRPDDALAVLELLQAEVRAGRRDATRLPLAELDERIEALRRGD